ncbi:MAG: hypothetical protein ACI8Q1_001157 [Parvicella sp.]|jgi:hypothetical protein
MYNLVWNLFNLFIISVFTYIVLFSYGRIKSFDSSGNEKFDSMKWILRIFGYVGLVISLIYLFLY